MQQDQLKECIKLCWECRNKCQKTLYGHCLEQGGEHVEANHVLLMTDCIEICQTSADFMIRGSQGHGWVCEACAVICEKCAESCAQLDGEKMQNCAQICRRCAQSCREMSKMKRAA